MGKLNSEKYNILPYEKCLRYGPDALTDAELLAVIIRSGTRNKNCIEIAEELLAGSGILGLKHMKPDILRRIEGIGTVKAVMLSCISELATRISTAGFKDLIRFTNSSDVSAYYMERLRHLEKEHFILMMLNNKCSLLHESVLSVGTVNSTCVSQREIFKEALSYGAVYLIIVHNHPSGDPSPSEQDINTTGIIKDSGNLLGIPLIDHIIIGDHKYFSFKEENLI